jgi:hypothetical protein
MKEEKNLLFRPLQPALGKLAARCNQVTRRKRPPANRAVVFR